MMHWLLVLFHIFQLIYVGAVVKAQNVEENELFPTNKGLETFYRSHGIKTDADVKYQSITEDETFTLNGRKYSLEGLEPLDIFTETVTCLHDGKECETPPHTYLMTKVDPVDQSTILVRYSEDEIAEIFVTTKQGSFSELIAVSPGTFATVEKSHYDFTALQNGPQHVDDGDHDHFHISDIVTNVLSLRENGETLEEGTMKEGRVCFSYLQIDLAVAYESTFCEKFGAGSADSAAASIIAKVSQIFQQEDLCTKVKISHLEGFCNPESDPYRPYMNLNLSGCSNEGLLDGFQDYWNANRQLVDRDLAHLLTGKALECVAGKDECIMGCAYSDVLCDHNINPTTDRGYAASVAVFDHSSTLGAMNIVHEIAHNCGAEHPSSPNPTNILSPDFTEDAVFGPAEIKKLVSQFNEASCIQPETSLTEDCRQRQDTSKRLFRIGQRLRERFYNK